MIALRRSAEYQELFIYGEFNPVYETEPGIIGYERRLNDQKVLIINNAKSTEAVLPMSGMVKKILLSNYENTILQNNSIKLQRFQLLILEPISSNLDKNN